MSSKAMTLSLMVVAGMNLSIWGPQAKAELIARSGTTRTDTCGTFQSELNKGTNFSCERSRKSGDDKNLESHLSVEKITEKDDKGEDVVKEIIVNVRTEAGCDGCGVRTNGSSGSLRFSGDTDFGKIRQSANDLVRELETDEVTELDRQIDEKKKAEALKKAQEKCLRDEDGERIKSSEDRFQCKVDRLAQLTNEGLDDDEIEEYYNDNLRDKVNEMAKSPNKADRDQALEILNELNSEALTDKIDDEISQNIQVIEGVNSVESRLEFIKTRLQTVQMLPDGPQKVSLTQQITMGAKTELARLQQEIQLESSVEVHKSLQTGRPADLTLTSAKMEALTRSVSTSPELMTLGILGASNSQDPQKSGNIVTSNQARTEGRVGTQPVEGLTGAPVTTTNYSGLQFGGINFAGGQSSLSSSPGGSSRGVVSQSRLPMNRINQNPQNPSMMNGVHPYNSNLPLNNTIRLQ